MEVIAAAALIAVGIVAAAVSYAKVSGRAHEAPATPRQSLVPAVTASPPPPTAARQSPAAIPAAIGDLPKRAADLARREESIARRESELESERETLAGRLLLGRLR